MHLLAHTCDPRGLQAVRWWCLAMDDITPSQPLQPSSAWPLPVASARCTTFTAEEPLSSNSNQLQAGLVAHGLYVAFHLRLVLQGNTVETAYRFARKGRGFSTQSVFDSRSQEIKTVE